MDKEHKAVERLRLAAEMSETYYAKPLIITTSGGKDSDACLALARAAGIRYEVQHNHTTADAPETVYHVRETFRRLENEGIKCTVNLPTYKGQRVTMWSLRPQKLMPPTRVVRYCCSVLKEQGGKGRMITTGVRWAESAKRRKNRGIYEKQSAVISRKSQSVTIMTIRGGCLKTADCRQSAFAIQSWTGRTAMCGITFVPSISRSIRCMSAASAGSVASAARWRDAPQGRWSLPGIRLTSGCISGRLSGC